MPGDCDQKLLTLEELRAARGLQARRVAARIGVNPATVSRYERSANPALSTLNRYVNATGGDLVLVAVYREPDGTVSRHLVKAANAPPRLGGA